MSEAINRDGLLALYAYNAYANRLVLEEAQKLTAAEWTREVSPSHGSVQALLLHMLACEAAFLARSQEQPLDDQALDLSTLAQIRSFWDRLAQDQQSFISSLDMADLTRLLPVQIRDQEYHFPIWQLLTQALVHSIHHRGELSIVLTGLGYPLPTLDIIVHWIKESGHAWPF